MFHIKRFASIALLLTVAATAQAELLSELGVLDLSANGGINPATGAPWQAGDTYRLTFITRPTFTATSTNIDDYNVFVQGVANGSSLGLGSATWKVIGSTDTVDARTNTGTNLGPVGEATFLMDGSTIFAQNYADLWNGTAMEGPNLFAAPDLDEEGVFLAEGRVFTGSNNGLNTSFRQLGDASGVTETGTNQPNNNQRWLIQFNQSQTNPSRFYALSDPLTIQEAVVPEPASVAIWSILGLGLAGLGVYRARRKK